MFDRHQTITISITLTTVSIKRKTPRIPTVKGAAFQSRDNTSVRTKFCVRHLRKNRKTVVSYYFLNSLCFPLHKNAMRTKISESRVGEQNAAKTLKNVTLKVTTF